MRWLSVLCLVLVCVMSTVQVSHNHDLLVPTNDAHQSVPGPDHCPLCIAMHSAMPRALQAVPEPVIQVQAVVSVAAQARRVFQWNFAQATRPPPRTSDNA